MLEEDDIKKSLKEVRENGLLIHTENSNKISSWLLTTTHRGQSQCYDIFNMQKEKKHHYITGILHLASLSFKKWRWKKDILWLVKLGLVFTEYYYPHILNFLFFVLVFLYIFYLYQSVHFSHSVLSDFLWPHLLQHDRPTCQSPTPRAYSKHMSIGSVMPSNHLILCCPLLIPPSIFPSIRVFSSESVLRIRWSKYWSFSFSISLSNEYSGLISIRMD